MLRLVLILLAAVCLAIDCRVAAQQQDLQEGGEFTGIHSKRGVGGRPNTVRITNGKTFLDITEQQYRERGYIPVFEILPMVIVQRIPARIPVPAEQDK